MYAFEYHRPSSVQEAVQFLKSNPEATVVAGGHTLIPTLKQRLAQPSDLIDLNGIGELKEIKEEGGGVTIGAMCTHGEVTRSETVRSMIPGLAGMAAVIGDAQVKNRGTIGGSIANNDPAADYPAGLLALDATVRTDRREIKADDFFAGMFETALDEGELVTAVHFKKPERSAYAKFRNPASRYSIAGVMVADFGGGNVRVGISGAGPTGYRGTEFEQALSSNFSADAVKDIKVSPDGLNSDIHASAEYRAHLITVMAKRAVKAAIDNAFKAVDVR
jgi:carbon-monoxide dehydrogenase medium subunit